VDVHRRNIMDKLALRSVAELTKYAVRIGLVPI
jgi:DNA-binding CsgD family transcriptional regulator